MRAHEFIGEGRRWYQVPKKARDVELKKKQIELAKADTEWAKQLVDLKLAKQELENAAGSYSEDDKKTVGKMADRALGKRTRKAQR